VFFKQKVLVWSWWCISAILATWEAKIGRSWSEAGPGKSAKSNQKIIKGKGKGLGGYGLSGRA
jgi:hypothetical protein